MDPENSLLLIISAVVLGYLLFALIRPEKF